MLGNLPSSFLCCSSDLSSNFLLSGGMQTSCDVEQRQQHLHSARDGAWLEEKSKTTARSRQLLPRPVAYATCRAGNTSPFSPKVEEKLGSQLHLSEKPGWGSWDNPGQRGTWSGGGGRSFPGYYKSASYSVFNQRALSSNQGRYIIS